MFLRSNALVQRCQWHKRENVIRYLPKGIQGAMRHKLQEAYEESTYEKLKGKLLKIKRELQQINRSARTVWMKGLRTLICTGSDCLRS